MTIGRPELPRVYGAFFGRFLRPTPIQERAVPPILEGKNVFVVAPTATGKTEAYAAPLAERFLGTVVRKGPVHTIFVAPTRALTNDLYRRLAPPFEQLGIPLGRYTGEHRERVAGSLPPSVIVTPEALDSLVTRRPETMKGVRAIVLDELHILDGTPRGDQLRLVLHRLDRLAGPTQQRLAASATVPRPAEMASRYLGEAEIVEERTGERSVAARRFFGRSPRALAGHLETLAEHGFRKILVFVNSRRAVEHIATFLSRHSRFRDAVFPHHGSLSRTLRERTERRFLEAPAAVAVATLTLELGIDIGSVDYVLLAGVPPSVSSLLQRIGRGNRRTGKIRVGYACADAAEELLYRILLERGVAGDLCAGPYSFRSSVLVQQALAIAGAEHFVTVGRLAGILPPDLKRCYPPDRLLQILDEMVRYGLLEPPQGGRYVLTDKTERWYAYGRVHSNIDDPAGVIVEDRLTGEVVGRMDDPEPAALDIRLGGQDRRIRAVLPGRVLTDGVKGVGESRFPVVSIPTVSSELARTVVERLGAEPGEMLVCRAGDGWLLLHGLGTCWVRLFADYLQAVVAWSPYVILLEKLPETLPLPDTTNLENSVSRNLRSLERAVGMGPYQKYLPREERIQSVVRLLNLEGLSRFLQSATLRRVHGEAPTEWRGLLGAHRDDLESAARIQRQRNTRQERGNPSIREAKGER
ncbi:MAG: hypothetical protein KatS3mg076_2058 [Candidatus Binatia bacterium]|nr:MAG: hypothetical protein KatS3mg076_2058 [Candidatus Binatia bacterium]